MPLGDGQLDALQEQQKAAVAALSARLEGGDGLYDDPLALVRYLRARNWDLDRAEAMIRGTGAWRKDFGYAKIFTEGAEEIAREARVGSIYVRGYDKMGRPALYLKPGKDGFNAEPGGMKYLVYCVERAIACLEKRAKLGELKVPPEDPVARKFVLLVDFHGISMGSLVPLTIVRDLMVVMQDHYPERLGLAFFVNTPWLLQGFFNAASTFLDPVTLAKFRFLPEEPSVTMSQHFELSGLEKSFGGCDEEPFCSHVFLTAGEVFGLEYAEQLRLSADDASFMEFLHVYRHWLVLRLPSQKRFWLRQLAKQLSTRLEVEKEYFMEAAVLLRYLRAHHWDVDKAADAAYATALWRAESIPALGEPQTGRCSSAIIRECAICRFYLRGFDLRGRPILYVKFHHKDSGHYQETVNYVIYVMERLVAVLRRMDREKEDSQSEPVDCATVIVDFTGYAPTNRPPLQTILALLRIFQEHYPETLGDIFLFRPPKRFCLLYQAWQRLRCSSCFPLPHQGRSRVTLVSSVSQWRSIARSIFDCTKLESSLGGHLTQPFTSKTFLSKKVNGMIFGSEYQEQLSAPEEKRQRVSFNSTVQRVEESPEMSVVKTVPLQSEWGGGVAWLFR